MTEPVRCDANLLKPGGFQWIPSMDEDAVAAVRALTAHDREREQTPITTYHMLHAGMYARSIKLPAGVRLTGALIKRATTLILSGDVTLWTGEREVRLTGYHVLAAAGHRKQAFLAHADTHMTMLFPTTAKDVRAAEDEFTDEGDQLFSRNGENVITITEASP